MAIQRQLRRGTTAEVNAMTPAAGELVADTTLDELCLGNGVTTGGVRAQKKDATLTALAAYNTNGFLAQSAADTFAGRTITGTANEITVTNGDGVSGNPTLALANSTYAFSSRTSTATSCTAGGYTKVQFNVEDFDLAGEYDNATNFRYTPQKAGKYQVSALVALASVADTKGIASAIYKNGTLLKQAFHYTGATANINQPIGALITMNGTTDYLEVFVFNGDTSDRNIDTTASGTHFSAFLTRV